MRDRLPKGKGCFILVQAQTYGGDPHALVEAAKEANIGHLFFHIHDGYLSETKVPGGMDLTPHIKAAHAAGIECWGWGAVYKTTWSQGADRVIEAFAKHPELIGYGLDAEAPIKGSPNEAMALMKKLRYYLPDIPIGLSSYRFPSYHPTLPWNEFRSQCDFDMPQVYWEQTLAIYGGASQLENSYKEFKNFSIKRPYIPTGPAYKVGSWSPSMAQLKAFFEKAKELNLPGVNFWVLYQSMRDLPNLYTYIQNYAYSDDNTTPTLPLEYSLEEKVAKLWEIHPEIH
jgi:hypothetical protein